MDTYQHQSINRTRKIFLYLFWIIVLIVLFYVCKIYLSHRDNPNQTPKTIINQQGFKEIILSPDDTHNYIVSGEINHYPVTFLIDTGASAVSIPKHIANKLKLSKGPSTQVVTANGKIQVFWTKLESLSIGDIRINNINGFINPYDNSNIILLGMNALKKLTFIHKNGQLILMQSH